MNNRDLLEILGEIDEELIEDAAPVASTERVARPKKFNFGWIKPLSIAASFVIVLGGIIAAKPLLDLINSPDIDEPETLESQGEADEDLNESPDDGEPGNPPSEGNPPNVENPPSEGNPPYEETLPNGDHSGGDIDEGWNEPGDGPELGQDSEFAALIESMGALKLHETVRYNENKTGFAPPRFTLDESLLEGIAGVLYMCNGEPVYGLSIDDLGDENVVLENTGANSVGFAIYSNGYIGVNGIYYGVGAKYTDKIINIVKTDGKAPDGFFWNDDEDCWQTHGPEDEEFYEDIDSDTAIESERDK